MRLNEPNTLKVRLHQVGLGRPVDKLRVMLTGDWHISPIVSEQQLEFLKEAVVEAEPDLIILQGDLVDSPIELRRETSLKKLVKELKLCSAMAPTVLVLGSHDYITPTRPARNMKKSALMLWRKICQKCGVKLLINEWVEFPGIRIFGAFQDERCMITSDKDGSFKYGNSVDGFLQCLKDSKKIIETSLADDGTKSKVNWFAAHAPILNTEVMEHLKAFDVISFGHTHGGVVPRGLDEIFERFGWHFGLISAGLRPFPRRVRGVMPLSDSTILAVNPGMVATQFCAPRLLQNLNFIKAAEVSVLELSEAKGGKKAGGKADGKADGKVKAKADDKKAGDHLEGGNLGANDLGACFS